jgi:PhnB protein
MTTWAIRRRGCLTNGGTVRVPLAKQFWGDTFGAITDKYGIGWQVNIGAAGT